MKLIIILSSILFLFQGTPVSGQTIAFANYPITDYTHFNDSSYVIHHRRHCYTSRIGAGILIGSGVMFVTGAGIALLTKDSGDLGGALLIVSSQLFAGIGGIVMGCGRHYEKRHKARFAIIGKGNQLGLAYNLD